MKKNHGVSLIAGAPHFVVRPPPRSSLRARSPGRGLGRRGSGCMLYLIKELRVEKTPLQFVPSDP